MVDPRPRIRAASEADLTAMEWEGEYRRFRRLYQAAYAEVCAGRRLILLADDGPQVVGQIIVQFSMDLACLPNGRTTGYLYSFRVRPAFRGRGVGSQLIEAAEAALRQRKYEQAAISAAKDNPRARRLYERLGYRLAGEDPGRWTYLDDQGQLQSVSEPADVLLKTL